MYMINLSSAQIGYLRDFVDWADFAASGFGAAWRLYRPSLTYSGA